MKTLIISILVMTSLVMSGQNTATNFNCNDCDGINHDLFTELDAGKVVVLVWVMPCATCIHGALAAQTEVRNALTDNPGKVLFYIADDYANTSCQTLKTWCNTNSITDATLFRDNSIRMTDYGTNGMPKIVVLGGGDHKVYYNKNAPDIVQQDLSDAIAVAISDPGTGTALRNPLYVSDPLKVYPNPVRSDRTVTFEMPDSKQFNIEIQNELGQIVRRATAGTAENGDVSATLMLNGLPAGMYFVTGTQGSLLVRQKLIVE